MSKLKPRNTRMSGNDLMMIVERLHDSEIAPGGCETGGVGRVTPCAPLFGHRESARRGLTRPTLGFMENLQSFKNSFHRRSRREETQIFLKMRVISEPPHAGTYVLSALPAACSSGFPRFPRILRALSISGRRGIQTNIYRKERKEHKVKNPTSLCSLRSLRLSVLVAASSARRGFRVLVYFGGARLLTSRLARTLAPPKIAKGTTTGFRDSFSPSKNL